MRMKYIAILVAIFILGLIVLGRVSNTLVDWLWFSSIGYEGVFWTIFTARTGLFLVVFAASTGVFWLSGWLALRFARRPASWPARAAFSRHAPPASVAKPCPHASRASHQPIS